LIGRVNVGQRDGVFLVSKVWPTHVMGDGIARACDAAYSVLGDTGASLLRDPRLHVSAPLMVPRQPPSHWPRRSAMVISLHFRNPARPSIYRRTVALSLTLTPGELHALDAAHPPPNRQRQCIDEGYRPRCGDIY